MQRNARITDRSGFAMVTAMSLTLLITLLATGIYMLAKQEMHSAKKTRSYLKAKVIAEAGANAYYNTIKTNFIGFGAQPVVPFGGGEYQVTLTRVGDDRAYLVSKGTCDAAEAYVSMSLRNFRRIATSQGQQVRPVLLDNAITSGGALTLSGKVTVNGDIASANSIVANGNSGQVTGDAYAPDGAVADKHGSITGTEMNDPERYTIDWDTFLKLEDYLAHAVTWDGRSDLSTYPANTILYVPNGISVSGSPTLQLCIIAVGDIKIAGQATLLKPSTFPTLVSRDGSIKLTGGSSISGLIVAMGPSGTLATTGGGNTPVNIEGSVVCGGSFKDAGNWTINHAAVPIDLIPPGQSSALDNVVVVAWQ